MTTITTGTTGPKAWKIALVAGAVGLATLVVVSLPQTTSDTDGQPVTEATAALPESVTGFEYGNESTSGQVASSGVTAQYLGNSGELFPYENGPAPQTAPQITQEYLDGPSSGAQRVDPRAAAAVGLSPGAIDAVVGGTTQVATTPDNLADAQARASVDTQAQALAVSDEALVNPVAEVNAAQLIQDIIASERSAPANALAASDEALVNPVPEINAAEMIAEMTASERSVPSPALAASDEALVGGGGEASAAVDWDGLRGPFQDSTVGEYYTSQSGAQSAGVDPADIKFLEGSPEVPASVRTPQQNVSMR